MIDTPNLIVGAGPAGLAMAGRLRKMQIDFEIVEQSDRLAPAWHQHYDRLHLHTVKQFSALPHRPFPDSYPPYVPKEQLLAYYRSYAEELAIQPHFLQQVQSIQKQQGHWITETTQGQRYRSAHVIVCTGFNRKPNMPDFPGMAEFAGTIVHSSEYKNPQPYEGQRILVVGMGNSGAEIALDLAEAGLTTYLSVRGPVNIVPRDFLGRPTQKTAKLLAKLPRPIGDAIGRAVRRIAIGNLKPYGLQTPRIAPARQLRLYAKTPVIDIGTVQMIKNGAIQVKGAIKEVHPYGVLFEDGSFQELDAMILATGYRADLEAFIPNVQSLLNEHGHPKQAVPEKTAFQGLYFVGYDGYSNGILESIYRDSGKVAAAIFKTTK